MPPVLRVINHLWTTQNQKETKKVNDHTLEPFGLCPSRLVPGFRLRPDDGPKHVFQNNLASERVKMCLTDTDESVTLSSQLFSVLSNIFGVTDFIKDRPGNVFLQTTGD